MKKVILGLSGGVDSSVAMIKLIESKFQVEAMFMRNWDSMTNNDFMGNPDIDSDVCPQELDYQDAKSVADKFNIKLHRIDFIEEYWNMVFSYFLDEYKKGRTPNPDVMCNKYIKFDAFLKKADELGADYIAMGHYARVRHDNDKSYLLRSIDTNKDQTYFLCMITQAELRRSLFPIGDMNKTEVRKIASENGLVTAKKKDSTGICFIGERNFKQFLKNYLPAQPGKIMTTEGKTIGQHDGLMYYTIGQRKGLGIGGMNEYSNEPWFVIGKDMEKNILYVGQSSDNIYLMSTRCIATDCNWITDIPIEGKLYQAKFRYRQKDNDVKIKFLENNSIEILFENPVSSVTPGQAAVIYDGDVCLGGAIIDKAYYNDEVRRY